MILVVDKHIKKNMANTNRCYVYKPKAGQAVDDHAGYFDEGSGSYCIPISQGWDEDWIQDEINTVAELSLNLSCPVGLIFVECWGGDCDHWAQIYNDGKLVKQFKEHPNLKDIMLEIGIDLPDTDCYQPFTRKMPTNQ